MRSGWGDVTSGMLSVSQSVRSRLRRAQLVCVCVRRIGFEYQNVPGSSRSRRSLARPVMRRGRRARGSGFIDAAGICVGGPG